MNRFLGKGQSDYFDLRTKTKNAIVHFFLSVVLKLNKNGELFISHGFERCQT